MLNILLTIVAWWLSLWDLRTDASWPMLNVLVFFAVACLLYVLARMVSAPIAAEGIVDLQRYHLDEGRKYAGLFAVECAITAGTVFLYGSTAQSWVATNWATLPTMEASIAAASTNNRRAHSAALAIIMILWIWYYATLQGALR